MTKEHPKQKSKNDFRLYALFFINGQKIKHIIVYSWLKFTLFCQGGLISKITRTIFEKLRNNFWQCNSEKIVLPFEILPPLSSSNQNQFEFVFLELWFIWFGGGKGYFRHPSKLFCMKGIGVGQTPIFCHFWICGWTSFPEKLKPSYKICLPLGAQHPQIFRKCYFWYLFHITKGIFLKYHSKAVL